MSRGNIPPSPPQKKGVLAGRSIQTPPSRQGSRRETYSNTRGEVYTSPLQRGLLRGNLFEYPSRVDEKREINLFKYPLQKGLLWMGSFFKSPPLRPPTPPLPPTPIERGLASTPIERGFVNGKSLQVPPFPERGHSFKYPSRGEMNSYTPAKGGLQRGNLFKCPPSRQGFKGEI